MYATRYPRNHLSSRFRPSVRKTLRNRTPQPQDALRMYETLLRARKKTKPAPANVCHRIFLNRARVSNPPDCADPGLHPDRRRDHVGKRPNTGRTATRASLGRRHLLNSFVHRLRTRPRLSRAKRHFGGSLHPSNVLGQSPLRPRDYRLQKGGTTCTWPAQWLLFSISDPKKRWAQ